MPTVPLGWLQVQAIQKFVTNRNLPERLKEDITRYVESSAVIRSEHGHQEDVFSLLSHTLQAGDLSSAPSEITD